MSPEEEIHQAELRQRVGFGYDPDSREAIACPRCGHPYLRDMDIVWPAYSSEDIDNTSELNEWQCERCAISFWM